MPNYNHTINLDDPCATEMLNSNALLDLCNALPDPIYGFDGEGVLKITNNSGAFLQQPLR